MLLKTPKSYSHIILLIFIFLEAADVQSDVWFDPTMYYPTDHSWFSDFKFRYVDQEHNRGRLRLKFLSGNDIVRDDGRRCTLYRYAQQGQSGTYQVIRDRTEVVYTKTFSFISNLLKANL